MTDDDLVYAADVPDGFSLEHDQVPQDVWANIRRWLSSIMLPSPPSVGEEERRQERDQASTAMAAPDDGTDSGLIRVPIPWEAGPQTQGRRIAQFGDCRYDYASDAAVKCVVDDASCPPIPDYIRRTLLIGDDVDRRRYTQCTINAYDADDDGIPWHVDHAYFGPEVLVYTFGEDRPLLFRRRIRREEGRTDDGGTGDPAIVGADVGNDASAEDEEGPATYVYARALPGHCSKYVLSGPARHVWEHSVASGGDARVSITFRSWAGSN